MEEQHKPPKKLRLIFGILFAVGMISLIGFAYQESQAEDQVFEIDQNQVEDEIGKLIIVKINDGVSSDDYLK